MTELEMRMTNHIVLNSLCYPITKLQIRSSNQRRPPSLSKPMTSNQLDQWNCSIITIYMLNIEFLSQITMAQAQLESEVEFFRGYKYVLSNFFRFYLLIQYKDKITLLLPPCPGTNWRSSAFALPCRRLDVTRQSYCVWYFVGNRLLSHINKIIQ